MDVSINNVDNKDDIRDSLGRFREGYTPKTLLKPEQYGRKVGSKNKKQVAIRAFCQEALWYDADAKKERTYKQQVAWLAKKVNESNKVLDKVMSYGYGPPEDSNTLAPRVIILPPLPPRAILIEGEDTTIEMVSPSIQVHTAADTEDDNV